MFMLRRTHENIIHNKNAAALGVISSLQSALRSGKKLVDEQDKLIATQERTIKSQQEIIESLNQEISSLRRSSALNKLAEIDAEEIKGP